MNKRLLADNTTKTVGERPGSQSGERSAWTVDEKYSTYRCTNAKSQRSECMSRRARVPGGAQCWHVARLYRRDRVRPLARPSPRLSSRAACTARVRFTSMHHVWFSDSPRKPYPPSSMHVFDVGDSWHAPHTTYAASGFVARTGADYDVESGALKVVGAGVGVVGTCLVYNRRGAIRIACKRSGLQKRERSTSTYVECIGGLRTPLQVFRTPAQRVCWQTGLVPGVSTVRRARPTLSVSL